MRSPRAAPELFELASEANKMQVCARLDPAKRFRLLELTPELEESLRAGSLAFKGSGTTPGQVRLCTDNSTYSVRRLKQSNSLLFARTGGGDLQVFASPFELLETAKMDGTVEWSQFPVYSGDKKQQAKPREQTSSESSHQPEWMCSQAEFESLCRDKPAVELDSTIHVIAPYIVYDIIVDIVSAMVEKGDLKLSSSLETLDLQTRERAIVVDAVFRKFRSGDRMDIVKLSAWTGYYLLTTYTSGVLKAEFIREWRLSLPIKLDTDLSLLRGSFIEPKEGWIHYFDPQVLSADPRRRFDDLFAIKEEWDLAEIEPFIASLVPATQKVDNWILKYARRRRTGPKTVVSRIRRQ